MDELPTEAKRIKHSDDAQGSTYVATVATNATTHATKDERSDRPALQGMSELAGNSLRDFEFISSSADPFMTMFVKRAVQPTLGRPRRGRRQRHDDRRHYDEVSHEGGPSI